MIYLFLSIAASSLLFIIFKLYDSFKINTLQAIVVNYITACAVGLMMSKQAFNFQDVTASKWFLGAIILGFLFIAVFHVMGLTAQRLGLSVTSVAGKMSVIIPVIFGILVYKESAGLQKIVGILVALLAVYFTSTKKDSKSISYANLWLPFCLFLGTGIIDTSIKYIETTYVAKDGIPIFTATIFGIAFIIGCILLSIQKAKGKFRFDRKSIIGGIALGVINFYSTFYLLKALQQDYLESSSIFTINNVAIVAISTLVGLVFFKEQISKTNWTGIALAIIAIITVTIA